MLGAFNVLSKLAHKTSAYRISELIKHPQWKGIILWGTCKSAKYSKSQFFSTLLERNFQCQIVGNNELTMALDEVLNKAA